MSVRSRGIDVDREQANDGPLCVNSFNIRIYYDGIGSPSPVPIPPAAWLFASALGIFGYLGKRKANA
jgi:hypothetical protein